MKSTEPTELNSQQTPSKLPSKGTNSSDQVQQVSEWPIWLQPVLHSLCWYNQRSEVKMRLSQLALLAFPVFAAAGLVGYGVCQAGCASLVMACYSAAGFIWGVAPPVVPASSKSLLDTKGFTWVLASVPCSLYLTVANLLLCSPCMQFGLRNVSGCLCGSFVVAFTLGYMLGIHLAVRVIQLKKGSHLVLVAFLACNRSKFCEQ